MCIRDSPTAVARSLHGRTAPAPGLVEVAWPRLVRRRNHRPVDTRPTRPCREGADPARTVPPARPPAPRSPPEAGAAAAAACAGFPPRSGGHTAVPARRQGWRPRTASWRTHRSARHRPLRSASCAACCLLLAGVGVVRRAHQHLVETRMVLQRGLDGAVHEISRAVHVELLEKKCEGAFEIARNGRAHILGQAPQVLLERSDGLLARLVIE